MTCRDLLGRRLYEGDIVVSGQVTKHSYLALGRVTGLRLAPHIYSKSWEGYDLKGQLIPQAKVTMLEGGRAHWVMFPEKKLMKIDEHSFSEVMEIVDP